MKIVALSDGVREQLEEIVQTNLVALSLVKLHLSVIEWNPTRRDVEGLRNNLAASTNLLSQIAAFAVPVTLAEEAEPDENEPKPVVCISARYDS